MVNNYPKLVERFPGYLDEFFRCRFRDALLSELCFDYEQVLHLLESEAEESPTDHQRQQDLRDLARKLEHEYLERLASHAANKAPQ